MVPLARRVIVPAEPSVVYRHLPQPVLLKVAAASRSSWSATVRRVARAIVPVVPRFAVYRHLLRLPVSAILLGPMAPVARAAM